MLSLISRSFMSARAFAKSPMQVFTFSTTPVVEKLKTHKGAAKRWKAIANGNFKRVGFNFLASPCTSREAASKFVILVASYQFAKADCVLYEDSAQIAAAAST
ncbi:hypothetical protein QFC20_002783 [Naganishia adeliensis]|uniref:Uncharacterized protein n=1 Tax=Naganishia adeliensis TaxID=92952 RepID=A0ACC2WI46_9TREE|nr:hypothetical protein QFC20_002783 [Naganishia adeliensis]